MNNRFAQGFNVFGGGVAGVDEKIAVLFGNFGAADGKFRTPGFFDQFPGFQPFRVFESGAGGLCGIACVLPAAGRFLPGSKVRF